MTMDVCIASAPVGFKSTATMMYGHVDRPVDWVEHLDRVRSLQDKPVALLHLSLEF